MARKSVRKWNPSLHPRDSRGRFTRSSTRVLKGSDTSRARSALAGFSPATVGAEADARAWMESRTGKPLGTDSALSRYLSGGWVETNRAIRSQKTPPPEVADIDAEFGELDEDVMLRRQVPLAMFAHIPVEDLVGMKVRDAAYASTSLDRPDAGPSAPDAVTMHIAAPAGTPAYVNAPDGEILLARDTEVAITRAEPNGRGGWDLYGVIIPKTATKRARPNDNQNDGETPPAPAGTSGPDGANAATGGPDTTDRSEPAGGTPDAAGAGGRGGADTSPRAAAAPDDQATPATRRRTSPRARGRRGEQQTADNTQTADTRTPDTGEPAPNTPAGRTVADLTRNDYVTVTGREAGRASDRTAAGYVASVSPTGDGDAQMVALTEYPNGAGRRALLITSPDTPVTPATPPVDPQVVLWRNRRSGRPVANPDQPAIVRRDVVRDTAREDQIRQVIADLAAGQQPAPGTPTGDRTPAAGTTTPNAPEAYTGRRERLAAGVGSGVTARERLGGGQMASEVSLVTFGDGDRAVYKQAIDVDAFGEDVTARRQQDAEELGAALAASLGVSVPAVHRASDDEVFMEHLDAWTAMHLLNPPRAGVEISDREQAARDAVSARDKYDTDAARLLGLADLLMDNPDRSLGNWMIDDAGRLYGIDHGLSFRSLDAAPMDSPSMFARHYVTITDRDRPNEWADNDLTPADVAEARRRIEALRPEFERLNHTDWHDAALARLDALAPHAKGTRNRIAKGDGPDAGDGGSGGTPTPTGPDAGPAGPATAPAGPAQQADIFGGTTDFVPAPRSAIGVADRPDLGRERAIATVQQLGMFDISDQQQMDGQMAMLDALLNMPETDTPPPPEPAAPAAPAAPVAPVSIVPDDLSGWNDEQLADVFRTVTGVHDPGEVDEDGASRIMAEWERREQAMADLVASVPGDLTGLPEDEVMGLYARLTGELGTMDHPAVERVGAELDRRQEEERLAEVNAPKRELLARPVADLTDEEIERAAEYAADLDDAAALDRVYAEWERRDTERETRERIEREAREQAEREAALQAAREAEQRAAAEHAQAQRDRMVDALAAAQEAAIVPAYDGDAVPAAVATLGEDGLRRVLGDAVVDGWLADRRDHGPEMQRTALIGAVRALPAGDRIRLVMAAAEQAGDKDLRDSGDAELQSMISQGMFVSYDNPDAERLREWGRRAAREKALRKIRRIREDNAREFRQWQIRAMAADPAQLTDAELEVAPALVAVTPGGEGFDTPGRLDALRAEAQRREADAGRVAAEKAAGPAAPARYRNPVAEYGRLRVGLERVYNPSGVAAQDRLRRARAMVYGLPEDADMKAIKAAEKKDPRPVADQAAAVMAWFRHLARYEGVADDAGDDFRGRADDPDVPDTPAPLPPADVANADKVWDQIKAFAQQEFQQGRMEAGRRMLLAVSRTYRIPVGDVELTREGLGRVQEMNAPAVRHDERTARQRAADFIAQYRALAAEDGVDPSDPLRYGPPDRGSRRASSRVPRRESTPEQERRIDALVARGWDWLDAYAEVHGADVEALRAEQARTSTGRGEAGIKAAYAEYVELQYLAAEKATRGYLLKKGREGKIDARRLFSGAWSTARANASEELLRWWAENPRLTYADFKAQLAGGAAARTSRERLVTAGKGNEFA